MPDSFAHLRVGAVTDVGVKRKNNEDSILVLPRHGVFCVADGMGGVQGGEVASQAAVNSLERAFGGLSSPEAIASVSGKAKVIDKVLNQASAWIKERADKKGIKGSGTTAVVLAFDGRDPSRAVIIHAGDSRAYRYRNGILSQLSRDHTVAEAAGIKDDRELPSMFKGVVTRAVGVNRHVELERTPTDVLPGDVYLLSSDGLDKLITDQEIEAFVRDHHDPDRMQDLAQMLVDTTNARGGVDNVSVILVYVGEADPDSLTPGDESDDRLESERISAGFGDSAGEESSTDDAIPTGDYMGSTPSREKATGDGAPSWRVYPGEEVSSAMGFPPGLRNRLPLIVGAVLISVILIGWWLSRGEPSASLRGDDWRENELEEFTGEGRPYVPVEATGDPEEILAALEAEITGERQDQESGNPPAAETQTPVGAERDPVPDATAERAPREDVPPSGGPPEFTTPPPPTPEPFPEESRKPAPVDAEATAPATSLRDPADEPALAPILGRLEPAVSNLHPRSNDPGRTGPRGDPGQATPVSALVDEAARTGRWGELAESLRPLGSDPVRLLEASGQADVYRAWTACWQRAKSDPAAAEKSVLAIQRTVNGLCVAVGAAPLENVSVGGGDPNAQASAVCAAWKALQDHLLSVLAAVQSDHLSYRGPLVADQEEVLRRLAAYGQTQAPTPNAADLSEAYAAVQVPLNALARWLDAIPPGPIPVEALHALSAAGLDAVAPNLDRFWSGIYQMVEPGLVENLDQSLRQRRFQHRRFEQVPGLEDALKQLEAVALAFIDSRIQHPEVRRWRENVEIGLMITLLSRVRSVADRMPPDTP